MSSIGQRQIVDADLLETQKIYCGRRGGERWSMGWARDNGNSGIGTDADSISRVAIAHGWAVAVAR